MFKIGYEVFSFSSERLKLEKAILSVMSQAISRIVYFFQPITIMAGKEHIKDQRVVKHAIVETANQLFQT